MLHATRIVLSLIVAVHAIGVCGTGIDAEAQETPTLQWRFQPGQVQKIKMDQSTEVSSSVDQRSQKTRNQMTLWMTWNVEQVDQDGAATITQTIDRIRLSAEIPTPSGDELAEFDTDSPDGLKGVSKKLYQLVSPLVGTSCTLTINPNGDIAKVEIPESSMEILRNAPSSMQIRNVLTDQGIRELFGRSGLVFPDQDLAQQPEWVIKRELENGMGKFAQTQTYRLSRSEGDLATITMDGTLEPLDQKATDHLEEFKSGATYQFDAVKGHLTHSQLETELRSKRPYRDLIINTRVVTRSVLTINQGESPE